MKRVIVFLGRGACRGPASKYAVILALVLVGALAMASSACAAGAPRWVLPPQVLIVHSTRVTFQMTLDIEELETKWKAQYAPAESNGLAPAENSSNWVTVDEGEIPAELTSEHTVPLGQVDPGEFGNAPVELRNLTPKTVYYARFTAENADSKGAPTVVVVPFKTLEVSLPEVPRLGQVEQEAPVFALHEITDTAVTAEAKIETNGSQTEYTFEYALPENGHAPIPGWKEFSSGAKGVITVAEDYAKVKASLTGLTPETEYYVRIRLKNGAGEVFQTKYAFGESFSTGPSKPKVEAPAVRDVRAVSARLSGVVEPDGSRTLWWFEDESPSGSGMWQRVAGAEGEISQSQAEALSYAGSVLVGADFTGLNGATSYNVRLSAKNEFEGVASEVVSSGGTPFETEGAPTVSTFAVHWLTGESLLRLLGSVNPKSSLTSSEQSIVASGAPVGSFTLTFDGETTGPIVYPASAESIRLALEDLPDGPSVGVEGAQGGPYRIWFFGVDEGIAQPTIEVHNEGLTGGTLEVLSVQSGGESYRTDYTFQYVSDKEFEEDGWSKPQETSPAEVTPGSTPQNVGAVVQGLSGGEAYAYRLVANSTIPATVMGGEESLVAPLAPVVSEQQACSNEGFRTGLSASLPDCRAYEQVTPVEKGGAQEPFHYRAGIESAVVAGEDGEHAVLEAPEVNYGGSGAHAGGSPYLFSRVEGEGWLVTDGAPQPETGIESVTPQVYSSDLTRIAFESAYAPSELSESSSVEYKIGPVGGPYATVATVPREDLVEETTSGWVAADADFSKLVLQTVDRTLVGGGSTGTVSGPDLYEYTAQGGLQQLNVEEVGGETVTIGSCGARMVYGQEDPEGKHQASSVHSVSSDGSRVFFEAVPNNGCSGAHDLYMRVDGSRTVNIGAYRFVAADADGTRLVLSNEKGELVGYDSVSESFEAEPSEAMAEERELSFLGIPVQFEPQENNAFARPDYTYWKPKELIGGHAQVYRYDRGEHTIECISCVSSFDPEPAHEAFLQDVEGLPEVDGGYPDYTAVSGNGDFAFFTTVAALVPQDVDGEVPPGSENVGGHVSPSTDVYEWRAGGVDGCGLVRGCLALITDGRGGYLNLLLGAADEGRDVFIYTRSNLVPEDHGSEGGLGEGNVYDVRMGGGFAGPVPPSVECEGDACTTPPSAPADLTPSSFTFTGTGNFVGEPSKKTAVKSKKKVKKKAKKKKAKKRKGRRAKGARVKRLRARRGGG